MESNLKGTTLAVKKIFDITIKDEYFNFGD